MPRSFSFATLSPRWRGVAFVMFAVLVWAGWMVLSAHSVRGTLTAYDITALRFGTAGIVMLPLLIKKGFRLGPWGIFGGIWLAAMMGAPYNTVAILGMKYAPTSHLAIINSAMLTVTTLGGIFLLREKTTWLRMLGIGISIAGVVCLLDSAAPGSMPHPEIGHAAFFIGGTMWAFYALTIKAWKVDALHATAAVCVYSALFYMPIYVLFIPSHIGSENMHEAAFQAVYQGIINSVFALLCFNRAIALLGASTASAFLPLIPAIATLVAIPFLGETPIALEWLGVLLAGGGVLLSSGMVRMPGSPRTLGR